jgi:hypothetical protein
VYANASQRAHWPNHIYGAKWEFVIGFIGRVKKGLDGVVRTIQLITRDHPICFDRDRF